MSPIPNWWSDERVDSTVNREYVYSQLRPDEQEFLKQSPKFGADLTDDTYLDWILTKAKRLFLILVETGIPDQIFGILDDSYDDGDLPIPEEAIADLRLSFEPKPALNKRFYKAQYRYLLRVLEDGEHIRYADEETVPVYATGLKATIVSLGKDDVDKVRLSASTSRYFVRKKIHVDNRPSGISETKVLSEIASLRKYVHAHLLTVYASYLQHDNLYVLFTPAPAYTLKGFLNDVPKAFDHLSKMKRRYALLSWPHCLASALRWLHANGRHHGAIRPSNIQVDDDFNIYLGQFDDPGVLGTHNKVDDIEAYQYAAPERWKRAVTMQTTARSKVMGASGGRTARRIKPEKPSAEDSSSTHSVRSTWTAEQRRLNTMNPTSTSYSFMPTSNGNFSRLQLSQSADRSLMFDGVSTMMVRTKSQAIHRSESVRQKNTGNTRAYVTSAMSDASSGSNKTIKAAVTSSGFAAGPELKTAVVQTWASTQHDLLAADMFSLGAVMMDIMTLLCKKGAGAFARHRSSKNRSAGRGGGLADASFHANIGQVIVWGTQLQAYAADRAKKSEGEVFKALGPVIQLIKVCLEREPEERLRSQELERRLGEYISTFADAAILHCSWHPRPERGQKTSQRGASEMRPIAEEHFASTMGEGNMSRNLPKARQDEWAHLRSRGLATTTIPSPGPASSLSSLSSFNFEQDTLSDTVVAEDRSMVSDFSHMKAHYGDSAYAAPEAIGRSNEESQDHWYPSDAKIDPYLTVPTESNGFRHASYSGSESSEDGQRQPGTSFLLPPSRPVSFQAPSPPPSRALPAIPNSSAPRGKGKRTSFHAQLGNLKLKQQ